MKLKLREISSESQGLLILSMVLSDSNFQLERGLPPRSLLCHNIARSYVCFLYRNSSCGLIFKMKLILPIFLIVDIVIGYVFVDWRFTMGKIPLPLVHFISIDSRYYL
jgi:hypothetical protein